MAQITIQDLYTKIDEIIKVSPAATDTTKLQGYLHRELLKLFADAIYQQNPAVPQIPYDWTIPFTRPEYAGQSIDSHDLAQGLFKFFHPAQPPTAGLSAVGAVREIGASTQVTLNYSFHPGTQAIDSVAVNGVHVPNDLLAGSQSTSTSPDQDTSFSMQVQDVQGLRATASAQVRYLSRFFLFSSPQRLAGLSDADLSAVLHAQNGVLVDNRYQVGQLHLQGEYYYVAYVNSLGTNPKIIVNGFQDTSAAPHGFTYTNANGVPQQFTIFCGENSLTGIYNIQVA